MKKPRLFFPGDLIEVRSASEILATLDNKGTLDGLPFMPEMLVFSGKQFRVSRRVEQTCVEGYGIRRISNTVFLEDLRCDGSAHAGCHMGCVIFWKEAWLKGIKVSLHHNVSGSDKDPIRPGLPTTKDDHRFFCQATELFASTQHLSLWDPYRWYIGLRFRNISLREFLRLFFLPFWHKTQKAVYGHSSLQPVGILCTTPEQELNLQQGDIVQIKSKEEIAATLDANGRNRGLLFTPLMAQFCGRSFTVERRVERIIREDTGEMVNVLNTVTLKGAPIRRRHCPGRLPQKFIPSVERDLA